MKNKARSWYTISPLMLLLVGGAITMSVMFMTSSVVVQADNFTDIFYTNSFRGAFQWFKKLDWVGMLVQIVISTFSLFGVALLVIRIMTSMLYLSAKGMWEEVHDLKGGGESADKDFLGMVGMMKTWASGKSGTGLDAIIGAVLMLLPDVKKYSDFGEKAGGDFTDDMNISQYMLKIALPTIMTVFFFAMGFNGTLFQFLAVTVDAMGTVADKAISVNYSGMINDLLNSGVGYQFTYEATGTNQGEFLQGLSKDVYGRCVTGLGELDANTHHAIGKQIEELITAEVVADAASTSNRVKEETKSALSGEDAKADQYWDLLEYEIVPNSSDTDSGQGEIVLNVNEVLQAAGLTAFNENQNSYLHIFIKQTANTSSNFFLNTTGN